MKISDTNDAKFGSSQVSALYLGSTAVWTGTHSSVATWLSRLQTYGVSAPSSAVVTAMSNLMRTLDSTNLRSKIKRLNLFVAGSDWRAAFFPVITDIGPWPWDYNGTYGSTVAALSNGPFQSSDYSLTTGFDASRVNSLITGTTKTAAGAYIDTAVSAGTTGFTAGLDIHFACHVNSLGVKSGTGDFLTEMGSINNSNCLFLRANYKSYFNPTRGTPAFLDGPPTYTASNPGACLYTFDPNPTDPRGFWVGTRTKDLTTMTTSVAKNNVQLAAYTPAGYLNPNTVAKTFYAFDSNTITIFSDGAGSSSNPGGLGVSRPNNTNYSDRQITMYSIGYGLTSTDVSNFNSAVATFNTAIGRTNY